MTRKVLLVDDDASIREALGQTLELADLIPVLAGSYIEAKDHILPDFDGVVVSDIRMPGKDGFSVLERARAVDQDLPVILLTGEGDIPMAVRGIAEGAFDFLEKPCAPKDFVTSVRKALLARAETIEKRRVRQLTEKGDAAARLLFGQSVLAENLRNRVRTVAKAAAEILVYGEPGTGTSKVAEVIHLLSPGAMKPFVKRAAASLTVDGLSEAIDKADGGTLFLDEVALLPAQTQFALLEHLEIGTRARTVAGTYRDLKDESERGGFNPDLYYKLDVMPVRIPSLRERAEDIPVLFRHYVSIACEQAALPEPDITPEVISRLVAQEWPGNARALMNAAMRFAMGLSDAENETELGLIERMAHVEKSFLVESLKRNGGNASEAARQLKLPRKTFYDKLAKHGIRAETYR